MGLFSARPCALRAYRWGEDGIAGISDASQRLCFSLAMWNGVDPILKERLFGLTNGQGNHGEDVKEYWFYLDTTPTHSYMKVLYKYPQREFPYDDSSPRTGRAARTIRNTSSSTPASSTTTATSTCSSSTPRPRPKTSSSGSRSHNRGPEAATLHLLPTLWFRNTWSLGRPTDAVAELRGGRRRRTRGRGVPRGRSGRWL